MDVVVDSSADNKEEETRGLAHCQLYSHDNPLTSKSIWRSMRMVLSPSVTETACPRQACRLSLQWLHQDPAHRDSSIVRT